MATAAELRMEIKEVLAEIAREAAEREAEAQAAAREAELKAAEEKRVVENAAREAELCARDPAYAARYEKERQEAHEKAEKEWQEIHEQIREQMKSPSLETKLETEWKIKDVAKKYFCNSLSYLKEFAHEQFCSVESGGGEVSGENRTTFDLTIHCQKSIALINVKYQPHISDIQELLKNPERYRKIRHHFKDQTIYLGIAGFYFDPEVETAVLDAGLAVIKQVGDTVVVQDERMKKF